MWLPINFDRWLIEIDGPDFRDAGTTVYRQFAFAIVRERCIGDLNQKIDIRRFRMFGSIKVRNYPDQHQVGLRFGVLVNVRGILHSQQPAALGHLTKMMVEPFDHAGVGWTDG